MSRTETTRAHGAAPAMKIRLTRVGADCVVDAVAEPHRLRKREACANAFNALCVYGALGRRVAASAEGLSAVLDGAEMLPARAGRRPAAHQR